MANAAEWSCGGPLVSHTNEDWGPETGQWASMQMSKRYEINYSWDGKVNVRPCILYHKIAYFILFKAKHREPWFVLQLHNTFVLEFSYLKKAK